MGETKLSQMNGIPVSHERDAAHMNETPHFFSSTFLTPDNRCYDNQRRKRRSDYCMDAPSGHTGWQ
jgi:hypothetical protein